MTRLYRKATCLLVAGAILLGAPGLPAARAAADLLGRAENGRAPARVVGVTSPIFAQTYENPAARISLAPSAVSYVNALTGRAVRLGLPQSEITAASDNLGSSPRGQAESPEISAPVKFLTLTALRSMLGVRNFPQSAARINFDNARRPNAAPSTVVRRILAAALAGAALSLPHVSFSDIHSEIEHIPPPIQKSVEDEDAAAEEAFEAALPKPVKATVHFLAEHAPGQDKLLIGHHVQMSIEFENTSKAPITISDLRGVLAETYASQFDILGGPDDPLTLTDGQKTKDSSLTLAPGEKKAVAFESIVWDTGELNARGAALEARVDDIVTYPDGILIALKDDSAPKIKVDSVLDPKEKKPVPADIQSINAPVEHDFLGLAAGAMAIAMLWVIGRFIKPWRWSPPKPAALINSAAAAVNTIAKMRRDGHADNHVVYREKLSTAIMTFVVDGAGLPERKGRSAENLENELARLKKNPFLPPQVELALILLNRMESRHSGQAVEIFENKQTKTTQRFDWNSPQVRERTLRLFESLVNAANPVEESDQPVSSFSFGNLPAVFLLLPVLLLHFQAARAEKKSAGLPVGSAAHLAGPRTWRARFNWLSTQLMIGMITANILSLAAPSLGIDQQVTVVRTVRTVLVNDHSDSMGDPFPMKSGIASGGDTTKFDALKKGNRIYIKFNREGGHNSISVVEFDSKSKRGVRGNFDYDADDAAVELMEIDGATSIGDGIFGGIISLFRQSLDDLEPNLSPEQIDARAAKGDKIALALQMIKAGKTRAALDIVMADPELSQKIFSKDVTWVIILSTDGDSNSDAYFKPIEAAQLAAKLGIRIYTIGIGKPGGDYSPRFYRTWPA